MSEDAHATNAAIVTETVASPSELFDLDTGTLSLDFVNTLENRANPAPRERLSAYSDLLAFSRQSGTLDDTVVAQLAATTEREPAAAAAALERALVVREALYGLFSALAIDEAPAAADLAVLNAAHAEASAHGHVALVDEQFVWTWDADPAALDRPLWPIVSAATDLLLDDDLGRLRQCAAHDCDWLFLDMSRNHSRRWCSMSSCGNRAKVGSFRERHKTGA